MATLKLSFLVGLNIMVEFDLIKTTHCFREIESLDQ